MPDGGTIIVCGRRTRTGHSDPPTRCGYPGCTTEHVVLCDYPLGGKPTCNAPACRDHATPIALNLDYCMAAGHPDPS